MRALCLLSQDCACLVSQFLHKLCPLWHCDIIKLFLAHRSVLVVADSVRIDALHALDVREYVHCSSDYTCFNVTAVCHDVLP